MMGLMCCVLMFGVLAIWLMSYSRETSNKEVAVSIVNQWGKSVYIQGPTAKENLDSAEWDERSLSNFANLEEKDRIAMIALEAARRITLTKTTA